MFQELLALGIGSGTIYRVGLTEGRVDAVYDQAGPFPDGVVVERGTVFWTTMGVPARDSAAKGEESLDYGLDYSQRNGGLHAVGLDGSDAPRSSAMTASLWPVATHTSKIRNR